MSQQSIIDKSTEEYLVGYKRGRILYKKKGVEGLSVKQLKELSKELSNDGILGALDGWSDAAFEDGFSCCKSHIYYYQGGSTSPVRNTGDGQP